MDLSVQELEAAINYWRARSPAGRNEYALSRDVNLLAPIYALMIYRGAPTLDMNTLDPNVRQLLHVWRAQHTTTSPNA